MAFKRDCKVALGTGVLFSIVDGVILFANIEFLRLITVLDVRSFFAAVHAAWRYLAVTIRHASRRNVYTLPSVLVPTWLEHLGRWLNLEVMHTHQ